jgi:hypothetical protein
MKLHMAGRMFAITDDTIMPRPPVASVRPPTLHGITSTGASPM